MEFVDFDRSAARQAIEACRSAAEVLAAAAARLTSAADGQLGSWSGESRIGFDANADDIARALRRESADLEETADAISQALADAQALEESRRQARLQMEWERERLERAGGAA